MSFIKQMARKTAISLFSGMGGDTLGLKMAGVDVIAYSEFVAKIRVTHERNFPECPLIGEDVGGNISKTSDDDLLKYADKVDIMFAGFPCQSFSTGGNRKVNDPRNTMFMEFVRATRLVNPDVAIGENVKGLLSKKTETGELYIDIIIQCFREIGYEAKRYLLSAHHYDIPQKRERLFIVCIKTEALEEGRYRFRAPKKCEGERSLGNIVSFSMKGAMAMAEDAFDFSTLPEASVMTDMTNEEVENDPHPYLILKRDGIKSYAGKTHETLFSFAKRSSPIHMEIVDIQKPTKTIICTYGRQPRLLVALRNKNGYFVRPYTPDELKQIQSFPAEFELTGNVNDQITMIGNAVPPSLVKQLIESITPSI